MQPAKLKAVTNMRLKDLWSIFTYPTFSDMQMLWENSLSRRLVALGRGDELVSSAKYWVSFGLEPISAICL